MLKDFYGPFHNDVLVSEGAERYNNSRILGHDPETGEPIYAKVGKNGGFIQLGDNEKESGKKPRFAPLPKRKTVKTVTLEQALGQLALPTLPRSLGQTKDGVELIAASGPFGPYLKAGKYNIPLGKDEDPYTISFETAEALYQAKISSIIADWDDIMIINGAYGPYAATTFAFQKIKTQPRLPGNKPRKCSKINQKLLVMHHTAAKLKKQLQKLQKRKNKT